MKQYSKPRKS